eukprot:1191765-Prorocentrum_minimum.AAC.5
MVFNLRLRGNIAPPNTLHQWRGSRGGLEGVQMVFNLRLRGTTEHSPPVTYVKGYDADVKGYDVAAKGYDMDAKGYDVDAKGYDADVKGLMPFLVSGRCACRAGARDHTGEGARDGCGLVERGRAGV